MFKLSLILVATLLAAVLADNINKDARALHEQNDPADADGNYKYLYELSNGISAQESGNANGVQGESSFVGDDGVTYTLTYVADENGFQPQGAHLPTPPPTPDAIIRALEYIAAHSQN